MKIFYNDEPVGISKSSSNIITRHQAKNNFRDLIPLNELNEQQMSDLTIANWKHGCWEDLLYDGQILTLEQSLDEVQKKTVLGINLVRLTLLGLERFYDRFDPKKIKEQNDLTPSIISDLSEEKRLNAEAVNFTITIYNQLDFDISIYKQSKQGDLIYAGEAPHDSSRPEKLTPDYYGQFFSACASTVTDPPSQIETLGGYFAFPGNTSWDIVALDRKKFTPCCNFGSSDNLKIVNNLYTYINLWWVRSDGSLGWLGTLKPKGVTVIGPSHIGGSTVATQGETIIDTFIIENGTNPIWEINPVGNNQEYSSHPKETYLTGENDYLFYQIANPQNDQIPQQSISLQKKINISDNTTFLYAGFFEGNDITYSMPEGTVLSIEDPNGVTYKTDTNTDSLYVKMSIDGSSIYQICVKEPMAGEWSISVKGQSNSSFLFQFQTVPTTNPFATIQSTLSSSLGSNWEEICIKGISALTSTGLKKEGSTDIEMLPLLLLIPAVVGALIVETVVANSLISTIPSNRSNIDMCQADLTLAFKPGSKSKPNILLIDANGKDPATKSVYKKRSSMLYNSPEIAKFKESKKFNELVGQNNSTKAKFFTNLKNSSLDIKYISGAGHGNKDRFCGYTPSKTSPWTPILECSDVIADPTLAKGKVFYFTACRTGSLKTSNGSPGLGVTLVKNGALAFVGYKVPVEIDRIDSAEIVKCALQFDLAFLQGKSVTQAQNDCYQYFSKRINAVDRTLAGILTTWRENMVGPSTDSKNFGSGSVTLFEAE